MCWLIVLSVVEVKFTLNVCCVRREAQKQAISWCNINDWFTISQVIPGIRIFISKVTLWLTAGLICVQSQHSEETSAICSRTREERPACSLLGISVWEPASCCWRDLLDLWSWWKCCWMQGLIIAHQPCYCLHDAFSSHLLLSQFVVMPLWLICMFLCQTNYYIMVAPYSNSFIADLHAAVVLTVRLRITWKKLFHSRTLDTRPLSPDSFISDVRWQPTNLWILRTLAYSQAYINRLYQLARHSTKVLYHFVAERLIWTCWQSHHHWLYQRNSLFGFKRYQYWVSSIGWYQRYWVVSILGRYSRCTRTW